MGIERPDRCLRQRTDCVPLACVASDDMTTYICVGANDGTTRVHQQDCYRKCVTSPGVETIEDCDQRDLTDEMSVIAQALSTLENMKANKS